MRTSLSRLLKICARIGRRVAHDKSVSPAVCRKTQSINASVQADSIATSPYLEKHPGVALAAFQHRLDHLHVINGIRQRRGHWRVREDRLREAIRLNRVLIARLKPNFLDIVASLVPQPARLVRRSIERDLDLDAPGRA